MRLPPATRLVACPAAELFGLVADVESYSRFMPGWREARIIARRGQELEVEQLLGAGPWLFRLHSVAHLEPPRAITIHAHGGPFTRLDVAWTIEPAGAAASRASLQVEYAAAGPQQLVLVPVMRALPQQALSALAAHAERS